VELLTVISIVSLLLSIMVPALGRARRAARALITSTNQRQIINAVNLYAMDSDDRYPESVATIGTLGYFWNWTEPTKLISYTARSPRVHRSMSAYIRRYLPDAETLHCPSAPKKSAFLDEVWAAGDHWDNPETPMVGDAFSGTYCLYWNYTGLLERRGFFRGPAGPAGGRGRSTLVVSCYLGYDHYRSPRAYGSCQHFNGASVIEGRPLSSAYWSVTPPSRDLVPPLKLYAGYADGRVQSYSSDDTSIMRVIKNPDTGEPYPFGLGPGLFYLPRQPLP